MGRQTPTTDRTIECHAVTLAVEAEIAVLWAQRQRDRRWYGAAWSPGRHERDAELRALVRILRTGRRLARRTVEQQDAITASKHVEWTAGELVAGFGK